MGSKQAKLVEKKTEPVKGVSNVQVLKHTTVPMPVPEPIADPHPDEDVSMFPAPHPEHIPLHVFCHADHHERLGEHEVFVDFSVKLMPHQHTLFCERRERVCGAVGKIQEGEELEVDGLLDTTGGYWIRSKPLDKRSEYVYIEGTENSAKYTLCAEDDGCYIGFQYAQLLSKDKDRRGGAHGPVSVADVRMVEGGKSSPLKQPRPMRTSSGELYEIKRTINSLGPVRPGPPRILDLRVEAASYHAGDEVRAQGRYIGGKEGLSEYWWFKIVQGRRVQLSEPLSVLNNEPGNVDPRVYVLKEEDVGGELKVKCRPIRSDGHKGEIFTSKASAVITVKDKG